MSTPCLHADLKPLDVAHADFQLMQLLLQVSVFLGHLFVLGLPLISSLL
jgi:hypothetical protein